MPKIIKELEKKLEKYEPDTDKLFKIAEKSLDEGVIASACNYIDREKTELMFNDDYEDEYDELEDEKNWQRVIELDKKYKILLERLQRDDIVPISD